MSLRHAILGVLEFHPLHGYALKSVMEKGIAYVWPVNLPAIYPCLRRLEEEGLVAHHRQATQPGRPDRKVFSVTPRGREELAEWRRLPPEKGIPAAKNPLFLKLLFAKRENLRDLRVWVDEALDEALQQAAGLRKELAEADSLPFFVRFLRESGLAHLELHVERLGELLEKVDRLLARGGERDLRQELGLEV